MDARGIVKALKGAWHGSYGMCRCPAHGDKTASLSVRDGQSTVLVKCFAGCPSEAVVDALKGMGLWEAKDDNSFSTPPRRNGRNSAPVPPEDTANMDAARDIWRACLPPQQTVAEAYLKARGIILPPPPSIRFHQGLRHGPTGLHFSAMVAAIQGSDGRICAVHRTYLNGPKKAGVSQPKMALGRFRDGAVRLAKAGPVMGVAEGIETALSAAQMFALPVWAACGSRLHQVALPPFVQQVVIFADNGEAGEAAAEKAREVHQDAGRAVTIKLPPDGLSDWNDALQQDMAA